MKKDLIIGGIYSYGIDENDTSIIVVLSENEDNVLIHLTKSYMRCDESHRDTIIEKIDEKIPRGISHNLLQFVSLDKEDLINNIHGYLGQVPEKLLKELIINAN